MTAVSARAALAGIGETRVGKVPDRSSMQLHAEATLLALADAGLEPRDVDLLVTANSRVKPYLYHADVLAEYLGIRPAHCLTINTGGSASVALLQYADAMISSGQARVAVIVKADNLATGMGRDATIESMAAIGHPEFESPAGPPIPGLYALIASRYQHERGVRAEDIAAAAVVDREHAARHPGAQFVDPLTVADVLGSRMVSDPMHLLECAPISDAGAAVVVTSAEHARDLAQRPVYLRGIAEHHDFEHVTQAADLGTTGAAVTGPLSLRRAGLTHADVDVAMIYDAFAFIQCMQLEDLGFCARGEGGSLVASGATRLGGSLPTNTHGGVLSHSHAGKPSAVFLLTEAVHQLRGTAVGRQVEQAKHALVHAEGGILASHCTAVLSTEPS